MAHSDVDSLIRITFGEHKLEAMLHITKGTPRESVDEMTVAAVATARGLLHSDELNEAIRLVVADYDPEADKDFERVIARGTPPEHGEHGRFELDDSLAEIQERAVKIKRRRFEVDDAAKANTDDESHSANHYDRSTLTIVKIGDRIGRIIPHTDGVDGIDVCGGSVPANVGKPCSIAIDERSIERTADDELIAKIPGLLAAGHEELRVSPDLEINGSADFSTGNIEFDGDILVREGIRDCFTVIAGGTIEILGLVEAAEIIAQKDIKLNRGMTGREKGSLRTGRDLHAKFIDSTHIAVGRDLVLERELSHCQSRVWRDIRSPGATLIGGRCTVAGSATFGQVGIEAGTPTVLRLGQIDELESLIREATDLLPKIEQRAENARQELEQLQNNTKKVTTTQAKRMAELEFTADQAQGKAAPLRDSIGAAIEVVQKSTTRSLTVHKRVLPGARIQIGNRVATVKEEIKGPVRIEADEKLDPVVIDLNTGSRTPLAGYAAMNIDESALDLDDVKKSYRLAA